MSYRKVPPVTMSIPAPGDNTPGISDPPPALDPWGARLRTLRDLAGMSREDLAVRIGKSPSYVKMMEANQRPVQKASTLRILAHALGLSDISELTGGLAWTVGRAGAADQRIHPATQEIAALVRRPHLAAPAGTEPVALAELQAMVEDLWGLWHSSKTCYSSMALTLPTLLHQVEEAVGAVSLTAPAEMSNRRRASAVRAQAWHLARMWLLGVQQYELAFVAAERALSAAQQADHPLLLASSAWNIVGVHNSNGHYEDAETVAMDALCVIAAFPEEVMTDRLHGMAGALHLFASIAAASQEDGDGAARHLEKADHISRSLPATFWDPWTTFSVSNLHPYAVGIQVELGRYRQAADLAGRGNVAQIRSGNRRATTLIDTARAHSGRGEDDAALAVLLQAERESPEQVGYSFEVRDTVGWMIHRWRVSDRQALHAFGQRLGLAA